MTTESIESGEWHLIETAPADNSWFDLEAIARDGTIVIIEELHYQRMFNKWEIWGKANRLSSYFKPCRWRARTKEEDTHA